MKVTMKTSEEPVEELLIWWDSTNRLPAVGDRVTFEAVAWVVQDRVWNLKQGQEPEVEVWVRYPTADEE